VRAATVEVLLVDN